MTSCVISACAITTIFIGEKLAKKMFDRMNRRINVPLSIILNSQKRWKYTVDNLFGGDILREMQNDKSSDDDAILFEKLDVYATPYINNFFNHTQKFIDTISSTEDDEKSIAKYQKFFSSIEYNFNASILSSLKKEIIYNEESVTENMTFIYCVIIQSPINGKTMRFNMNMYF